MKLKDKCLCLWFCLSLYLMLLLLLFGRLFWKLKKLWEVNEVKGQMLMSLVLLVIVSHVVIIVWKIILEVKEVMGS